MPDELVLTDTAKRMMANLPSYYGGNLLVERYVFAQANEIDRIDAILDTIEAGLVPATTDDSQGFLSAWELLLGLPVASANATVVQRQDQVAARFASIDLAASRDFLSALVSMVGAGAVFERNTPGQLQDTITLPLPPGSYEAGIVEQWVRSVYPSHRTVFFAFAGGFEFDASLLDSDLL